ncbi:hypothetical protein [Methylobacterium nigriterrae]|uniref:hypothetical protein n=1 Tax=Methylobacterium nigriterrae TaxID=3127512 RepID=UPI0030133979
MPAETNRTGLAQTALDAYLRAEGADRRSEGGVPTCEIVDLITDLLLLAQQRGCDPASVVRKAEKHVLAETGRGY